MSRGIAITVVLWLLLAVLPAGAVADVGEQAPLMQFKLRSHTGYRVEVYASRATVGLDVIRDEHARHVWTSASYLARATIDGRTVKADFGNLGRLSMRFVPSSKAPSVSCDATKQRRLVRDGAYVGSLRFRGEEDYVSVDVRRAKGTLSEFSSASNCPPVVNHGKPRRGPKITSLFTEFRRGLGAIYFSAEKEGAKKVDFSVVDESGGDRVAVYRQAYVEASPLTFATDQALGFASVSPPYPFSGTGQIQRNADGSRSWTGSLAVSFPGDAVVGLAGPEFKTQLTRQW